MLAESPVVGIVIFLLVAATLTMAGFGCLSLARSWLSRPLRLLLGPAIIHAIWAIALGAGILLNVPVKILAIPILGATLAAAVFGVTALWRCQAVALAEGQERHPSSLLFFVLAAAVAMAATMPYFWYGLSNYQGSTPQDGWSYVAYAQYIWEVGRSGDAGASPLYRYASHLAHTRHVASGQLGLLSVLTSPGDTQSSVGLFLPWCVFATACSVAAAATTAGLRRAHVLLAVLVAGFSGWTLNVILLNNFDNLAALPFYPTAAAMIWHRPSVGRSHVWLALLIVGLIYTYPEMAPLVVVPVVALQVEAWWLQRYRPSLPALLVAGAVGAALLSPYFVDLHSFFVAQLSLATAEGIRPGGGTFPGLVVPSHLLSGVWSLGGEFAPPPGALSRLVSIPGVVLFIGLAAAALALLRSKRFGALLALALPCAGAATMIWQQEYDYGVYKMILVAWWFIVLCIIREAATTPASWRRVFSVVTCAALLAVPTVASARVFTEIRSRPWGDIGRYSIVRGVTEVVGSAPVGIFVEDLYASAWALYYLRDASIRVGDYDGYLAMAHVRPLLSLGRPPAWSDVRYILTDSRDPGPVVERGDWVSVWNGGAYRLWDTQARGWAFVTDVRVPNQVEGPPGERFFWLGHEPSNWTIVADRVSCLSVQATIVAGPSVKQQNVRTLRLEQPGGPSRVVTLPVGQTTIGLLVPAGESTLRVGAVDNADTMVAGDSRTMLVGLRALAATVNGSSTRLVAVDAPLGLEMMGGEQFFWLGGPQPATLRIARLTAGSVRLGGDAVSGPAVPGVPRRRLKVDGADASKEVVLSHGPFHVDVVAPAGESTLRLTALDPVAVPRQQNGDTRPLVLGVRGLNVSDPELGACGAPK